MSLITIDDLLKWAQKAGYSFTPNISNSKAVIKGFSSVSNYKPDTLTWVKKQDAVAYEDEAALVIVQEGVHANYKNMIYTDHSKELFFRIIQRFWYEEPPRKIESDAVVLSDDIGNNVSIGYHCYIGNKVKLEDNVTIDHNVVIQGPCEIGEGSHISSGVIIGSDGFGYFETKDGKYGKVPHLGGVRIGKNVDIGANTCIDRGTIDDTIIGDGVKIDNLCHIAHNIEIGKNSLVIAQSMLGGSCHLGEHTYVAPGVKIMNQISMDNNSMAGLGAVVTRDVPEGKIVAGVPAKILRDR